MFRLSWAEIPAHNARQGCGRKAQQCGVGIQYGQDDDLSVGVVALVLGSALCHAAWNAMLKGGADRMWFMVALCVVMGGTSALALPFVPFPAPASWPYLAGSIFVHVVYNLLLVRMYASGELGQTYPIARGSSPLLVTLFAFAVAGETLTPWKVGGIVLVSGGIFSLGLLGRHLSLRVVPLALLIGATIAIYSVIDGIGARLAGHSVGYSAWMFFLWAIILGGSYAARHGASVLAHSRAEMLNALGGGIIGVAGYTIVIWAMTVAPMGPVSALRETSVVFAAIIARIYLKEALTMGRMASCIAIAAGAAMLGF